MLRGARQPVFVASNSVIGESLLRKNRVDRGTTPLSGVDICRQQPVSPPHDSPVILVSNSTEWTYLVVTATGVDTRPGEPDVNNLVQKIVLRNSLLHPFVTTSPRVSIHRLKNDLGWLSSRL